MSNKTTESINAAIHRQYFIQDIDVLFISWCAENVNLIVII